jgi:putative transposase
MLVVVDEFTRECLAIWVGRRLGSEEVLEVLAELFVARGAPEHIARAQPGRTGLALLA